MNQVITSAWVNTALMDHYIVPHMRADQTGAGLVLGRSQFAVCPQQ